jgi:hypothetical protein
MRLEAADGGSEAVFARADRGDERWPTGARLAWADLWVL